MFFFLGNTLILFNKFFVDTYENKTEYVKNILKEEYKFPSLQGNIFARM